ncbi:MAG: imidazole glycerol phosphate synthase subunit HisH [Candidatus Omnitrophica bacterium]|nr:imidazole glycerol phosphate synthase subunit HisH [Candidatus Omnitrophota bacterium]
MIAIIDYKMGNLRSVAKAFEKVGAKVLVTSKAGDLKKSEAIILPGVGAFGQGMVRLGELGIIPTLLKEIKQGKPFLGICLGMQLLFTRSYEHGLHKGLGIIDGEVKSFPPKLKIPHMGWNQVKANKPEARSQKPDLFAGIMNESYFYFVHSYYVIPEEKSVVFAVTDYGVKFPSVVRKDNVFGVQFHPEKSQEKGLEILKNFVKISSGN